MLSYSGQVYKEKLKQEFKGFFENPLLETIKNLKK